MGEWRLNRRYWIPFALAFGLQGLCMVGFLSLRLYSDYKGVPQPSILEGLLLAVGLCGLMLALVFGIMAVKRSALLRSRFMVVFVVAGVMLAIGTFTTLYLAGR